MEGSEVNVVENGERSDTDTEVGSLVQLEVEIGWKIGWKTMQKLRWIVRWNRVWKRVGMLGGIHAPFSITIERSPESSIVGWVLLWGCG